LKNGHLAIGTTFAKQTTQNHEWDGIFISDRLIERHFIDYPAKGTGYIAPRMCQVNVGKKPSGEKSVKKLALH